MAEVACSACHKPLLVQSWRTLGSSKKALKFLETFGGVPSALVRQYHFEQIYMCKPCLGRLESGEELVYGLQQVLLGYRQHLGYGCVEIRAVPEPRGGADANTSVPVRQ